LGVSRFDQRDKKEIRSRGSGLADVLRQEGVDAINAQLHQGRSQLVASGVEVVQRRGDRAVRVRVLDSTAADHAIEKRMKKLRGPRHEHILSEG